MTIATPSVTFTVLLLVLPLVISDTAIQVSSAAFQITLYALFITFPVSIFLVTHSLSFLK